MEVYSSIQQMTLLEWDRQWRRMFSLLANSIGGGGGVWSGEHLGTCSYCFLKKSFKYLPFLKN